MTVFRFTNRSAQFMRVSLLGLWFIVHFQFLFESNVVWEKHPLAIRYLFELYLIVGIVSFILALFKIHPIKQIANVVFFCLISASFVLLSALLADIRFGQPILFGLIEMRRTLSVFIVGAFCLYSRSYKVSLREVYAALTIAVVFQLLSSLIMQKMFPGYLLARDVPTFDPRKLRIANGGEIYCVYGIMCMCLFKVTKRLRYIAFSAMSTIGILGVSQTRTSFAIYVAVCLICLAQTYKLSSILFAAIISITAFIAICYGITIGPALVAEPFSSLVPSVNFAEITNSGDSIRNNTMTAILSSLTNNYFIGMGALSLLWNGGFQSYYGKYFFLADVGLVGELFMVGLLYPVFLAALAIYLLCLRKSSHSITSALCITYVSLYIILASPLGGLYYHSGFLFAFLFLLSQCSE